MRAMMHMELCLDEIRAELPDSSAILSKDEKDRLSALIDEAIHLVKGAVRCQTVASAREAELHWIRIAIRAAQGDGEARQSQQVAPDAPSENTSAERPDEQASQEPSAADRGAVSLRLVHTSPVGRSTRVRRSPTLRLVSRIAAALAIAACVGMLITHGRHRLSSAGQIASQPSALKQPMISRNATLKRIAEAAVQD